MQAQTTHTKNSELLTHELLLASLQPSTNTHHTTANMGRVRTKTVKKSAKVIIEYALAQHNLLK
jgi:hypothetical protein